MANKSNPTPKDTSGGGEFVEEGEAAQEKGYWGTRNNPFDDEEFALTTGPDAPVQDMAGNPVDVEAKQAEQDKVSAQAEKSESKGSQSTSNPPRR